MEAVKKVLNNYANFKGRARRSEFWWWQLSVILMYFVAITLDMVLFQSPGVLTLLLGLGLIIPNLAVSFRRLHDTDKTAWWIFISIIPLGGFVLLYFFVSDTKNADNDYGPNPKMMGTEAA